MISGSKLQSGALRKIHFCKKQCVSVKNLYVARRGGRADVTVWSVFLQPPMNLVPKVLIQGSAAFESAIANHSNEGPSAVAVSLGLLVHYQQQARHEGFRATRTRVAVNIIIVVLEAFRGCQGFLAVLAKAVLGCLFVLRCRQPFVGEAQTKTCTVYSPPSAWETSGTGLVLHVWDLST